MRVHLVCIILLVGVIPLLAGIQFVKSLHWNHEYDERMTQMKEQGSLLAEQIAKNGYLQQPVQPELTSRLSTVAEMLDGRIVVVNNGLVVVRDTSGRQEGKTLISKDLISVMKGQSYAHYNEADRVAELMLPIMTGNAADGTAQLIGAIVFESSFADIVSVQHVFQHNGAVLIASTAMILLVVALIVSGAMTKSLRTLSKNIEDVTESYDSTRIVDAGGYAEVNNISDAVGRMMERIEATEKSRQEFVSNVSHELKTPLTAIKVLSDSLVQEPNVPIEMYQEFIADINAEIDREAKIVNDLLSLVKLDKTSGELNITEININDLLEVIMRRLKPLALKRGIEMVFESYRTVRAEVDEVKLSLVFSNLIENAIKYNRDGGKVMVSLNADHKFFYVKIEDTGIGIPEEEQGLVFDRFYRVDKARSRETGGTGLGLSITKSAVQMHKGSIKVQSIPGIGSIFTVRIPLSFVMTVQ